MKYPGSVTRLVAVASGKTDVGRKRDHNEDQVLLSDGLGLFAVADGMGGHDAGDVASMIAAKSLEEFFQATQEFPDDDLEAPAELPDGARRLFSAVLHANREVYARSGKSANQGGMGSTVVALYVSTSEGQVHICHVGDSRCYRVRDGKMSLLTHDHSMINEALRLNPNLSQEILRQLPTNVVTRALGTKESVQPDVRSEPLQAGDIYLLCSDGLSGEITDEEIQFAIEDEQELEEACELLIAMANESGGRDNVSALLVRIDGAEAEEPESLPPPARAPMVSEPLDLSRVSRQAEPDAAEEVAEQEPTTAPQGGVEWDEDDGLAEPPAAEEEDEDDELAVVEELLEDDLLSEPPPPVAPVTASSPRRNRLSAAELRLDAAVDAALAEVDIDLATLGDSEQPADDYDEEEDEEDYEEEEEEVAPDHSEPPAAVAAEAQRKIVAQPIIAVGDPVPEPTPSEPKRSCRDCGGSLSSTARYCGMCGAKVAYEPDPDIARCEQCDAELLVGTKFCVMCGTVHPYGDYFD